MTELLEFLPGIVLSLSAVTLALMSPGPNIMAVIGTSMGVGRKQGVALALGVGSGTFVWMMLAVLGFTTLIAQYSVVMLALKILGGLYLLWLGNKALKSAASAKSPQTSTIELKGSYAYSVRWASNF